MLLHLLPRIHQKRVPKGCQKGSQNDPLGALGTHLGTISKNDPYFFPRGRQRQREPILGPILGVLFGTLFDSLGVQNGPQKGTQQ